MERTVLIDAGPLVAVLHKRDKHHAWASAQMAHHRGCYLTCEAVISESLHLLENVPRGIERLLALLERQEVRLAFDAADQLPAVLRLLRRYADIPMSFADACMVRMSESFTTATVFTTDEDFRFYRRQSRNVIPLIAPW